MSDLSHKESLNARLTELQTKVEQLELKRSIAIQQLKTMNQHGESTDRIFLEIEEVAKISAYFSDKKKFPIIADNFGAINKLAQEKKTSLTGELNNWNNNNLETQTQLSQEVTTIETQLIPLSQDIQIIKGELEAIEQHDQIIEEKTRALNEKVAETIPHQEGMDENIPYKKGVHQYALLWKVEEKDNPDNTDKGSDDPVGSLKILLNFGFIKSEELGLTYWFLKGTEVIPETSGAFSLGVDIIDSHLGDPTKGIKGLTTKLTIKLKLSAGKLTINNKTSKADTTSIQFIPTIGFQGVSVGGIGVKRDSTTIKAKTISQGGTSTDYIRTFECRFINKETYLECVGDSNSVNIELKDWSKSMPVQNLLMNHGFYDKESEELVLHDSFDWV